MKKLLLVIFISLFIWSHQALAQSTQIQTIEQSIQERNEERKALEREAQRLREELSKVGNQRSSLSQELSVIASERKSLENEILQTQNKIGTLDLEINKSESLIKTYSRKIDANLDTLRGLIRSLSQQSDQSEFEVVLGSSHLSGLFSFRDNYTRLQEPLVSITQELKDDKEHVFSSTQNLLNQQAGLSQEQEVLDDQKNIVQVQEQQKDAVLKETQNKESLFQRNLQTTLQNIAQIDQEIRNFESTLSFLLDSTKLPKKGSAVLSWPLDYVLITQRFGKTVSSERLYVSGSHSGMDFRASVGTPVYAVADGVVKGTGDTDQTCPNASFGKWVFIEHQGLGLSSTSGHLSGIKVSEGQKVSTGDIIGYAGNTGRSTAPHLHLTIYATEGVNGEEGVRVTNRPSGACSGKTYRMPLAPTAAYLDPIDFLPKTSTAMFKHASLAN